MFILVIFVIITMENTVSAADGGQLCLTLLFHRDKTKQGVWGKVSEIAELPGNF